ncbi:MAG TPA: tRNA (guanosine(37)-N1)-methyltransferase TrmD [Bacteroidales bacterium]|nr:tRNA (guanosine(37)-N1)-methyltransferase TrmD [Bacteroidales bacterium]HRZ48451.1 tRNA (guanosine(37)-N1)-methyltransferase TrmD [Bacteroidales bacterium]
MRIDLITIHPEIFTGPLTQSIVKRAVDKGICTLHLHNLRDYSVNRYGSVDDYPYGGGGGMVMMVEPVHRCITKLKNERDYDEVIYTSPDGELFSQPLANRLSMAGNLIVLCGHYKGVDERIREHLVTREISIGDYVLTGGELAAAVMIDAVVRLIPGVLGDEQSALTDSFQDGLVAPPVYTRPADYQGWKVPDVLLSGHDRDIADWRLEQAMERTRLRRPGLLEES